MSSSARVEDVVFAGGLIGLAPVVYGPSLARITGHDKIPKRLILRATGLAAVLLCASFLMRDIAADRARIMQTIGFLCVFLSLLGALVFVTLKQNNSFARIVLCLGVLWYATIITGEFHFSLKDNNLEKCEEDDNPFCGFGVFNRGLKTYDFMMTMGALAVGMYIALGAVAYFKQN